MPRNTTSVKIKRPFRAFRETFCGAIDLHFHGAFGTDLMTADSEMLSRLSKKLYQSGVSAFCPTTLSASTQDLEAAVTRLGSWIRHRQAPLVAHAVPLGIHLEGPFLNPEASGAHPDSCIRPFSFQELESLWEASQHTLKILTMAPELLSAKDLKALTHWASKRSVVLSIGHTRATQAQAEAAIRAGFRNVTHAWNAMGFHQREPGTLGAATHSTQAFIEVIADQVHLHPELVRWLFKLAPDRVCCVSDCAPSAGMPFQSSQPWTSFGPLKVKRISNLKPLTSSVTENGSLAGGGDLLPQLFKNWCRLQNPTHAEKKAWIEACTSIPLQSLYGKAGARAWEKKFKNAGHFFDW